MEYIKVNGYTNYEKPFEITGINKILVISDIHIPKHNKNALNKALQNLQQFDILLINGDLIDFEGASRYKKHPKRRQISDEIEIVKEFFEEIRKKFKKRIIYKLGNHEKRLDDYIWLHAEAFYGAVSIEELLQTNKYNIEVVNYNRIIKVNDLHILHGHEVKATGNLINVARNYLLKLGTNALIGHWHIVQSDSARDLKGKVKSVWVSGCLCDLYPDYNLFNRWEHGFAEVVTTKNKGFIVTLRRIINEEIF